MAQGQKKRHHSNARDVNDQVNDLVRQAVRAGAVAARIAARAQRAQLTANNGNNNDAVSQDPSDSKDSEDDIPLSQRSTNHSNDTSNNATISANAPSSNASAMSMPEPIITMVTECLATMRSVLDLTDRCITDIVTFNIRELMQQKEDLQKHGEWLRKEMRRQAEGNGG